MLEKRFLQWITNFYAHQHLSSDLLVNELVLRCQILDCAYGAASPPMSGLYN